MRMACFYIIEENSTVNVAKMRHVAPFANKVLTFGCTLGLVMAMPLSITRLGIARFIKNTRVEMHAPSLMTRNNESRRVKRVNYNYSRKYNLLFRLDLLYCSKLFLWHQMRKTHYFTAQRTKEFNYSPGTNFRTYILN